MSEKKYRLNIQDRYFSDAQGNTYFREPLKDASGYTDIPFMNFCPQLVRLLRRDDGFTISEKILFSAFRGGEYEPPVELEKRDMIGNQPHVKFSPGCRVFQGKGNCAKCGEMMGMQCEDQSLLPGEQFETRGRRIVFCLGYQPPHIFGLGFGRTPLPDTHSNCSAVQDVS